MLTTCTNCDSMGKLNAKLTGKKVRCPRCKSNFIAKSFQQKKWYYAAGSDQMGPVEQNYFDSLVADGFITPDTLVWSKGMADWQSLREMTAQQKKWYYAVGNDKTGPIGQEQFDNLVADGFITPDTLVWSKGMAGWQTLADTSPDPSKERCKKCHATCAQELLSDHQGIMVCPQCQALSRQDEISREHPAPEGKLKYGGLGSRATAKIIDLTFMFALGGMVEGLSRKLFPVAYTTDTISLIVLGTLLANMMLGVFYITWFVGKFGATPGKMVVNLKITTPSGGKIGYAHAFGRYCGEYIAALGVASGLTLFIFWTISGFLPFDKVITSLAGGILVAMTIVYAPAAFDQQKRTVYDRLCNTRVIAV